MSGALAERQRQLSPIVQQTIDGVPIIGRTQLARRADVGFSPRTEYEHPDIGDDPRPDPFAAVDAALMKAVAFVINKYYPGHPWKVEVSHAQGVIFLSIPVLMGATNKYVIPIKMVKNAMDLRRHVMQQAGEILERYELPRNAFSRDEFCRAVEAVPMHRRGFHGYVPGVTKERNFAAPAPRKLIEVRG